MAEQFLHRVRVYAVADEVVAKVWRSLCEVIPWSCRPALRMGDAAGQTSLPGGVTPWLAFLIADRPEHPLQLLDRSQLRAHIGM